MEQNEQILRKRPYLLKIITGDFNFKVSVSTEDFLKEFSK